MDFYNNINGIIFFIIIFIYWFISASWICPCNKKHESICTRHEFYGVQFNHFYLFIILGFFFPSFFYTWMILGILWELFEFFLHLNPNIIKKYIGGCLSKPPKNYIHKHNKITSFYVYKNIIKYYNPIDKFFGIKNSKLHAWHHSIAELIPNFLGFIIGYYLNKLIVKKYD